MPCWSKLCGKRRRAVLETSAQLLVDLESREKSARARRRHNKHRQRLDWGSHVDNIGPRLFQRAYRLNHDEFDTLLAKIRAHAGCTSLSAIRARASSGSPVTLECRLAATLRYLAGGSYIDICFVHGIAPRTFYTMLWSTMEAIETVETICFPIDDEDELERLATDFGAETRGIMDGCVGALDGYCLRIRKPHAKEHGNPLSFLNRKSFYSINVYVLFFSYRHKHALTNHPPTPTPAKPSATTTTSSQACSSMLQERPTTPARSTSRPSRVPWRRASCLSASGLSATTPTRSSATFFARSPDAGSAP
jgi:hypothetical protein|tara:strand:+ start:242 stop:1162 length:921 start_codon:yes stop_codon:yes gene_type:complete